MPKVLQINVTANWGSTGKIAEQINIRAMERGWDCYIAYGRNSNPSQSKLIKVGKMINVYEHYFENRFFDNEGLASRIPTKCFIKQIEEISPDIIHLHNIHDHWLNYKILFEYLNTTNIPIVWTQHDCWAFTGGCGHYSSSGCDKWQMGCNTCPRKKILIDNSKKNFNLKKSLFTANKNLTLVPVSRWLENEMRHSFFNSNKIISILNGVDIDIFHPLKETSVREKYGIGNKFLLIGLATAWSARKGLNDYIELSKRIPTDYVIMLIGLKKNQISKLPTNIIGIERTSNIQELVELYFSADTVLNLSYEETFGLTTAEGFACGTPGIVYNRTASPELIEGEVGYVIEAGNIEQLLSTIAKIKSNGKVYYSENCRKRAVEFYDKNKCFDKYVDLYEKLIKSKSKVEA